MTAKISYGDVAEGEDLKPWSYKVERVNLVMYAGASGDFNPIHWSPGFATSVGLPDTIATGMHTMARIGQYLTDWCGDPGAVVRVRNRFTSPVVVPDEGATVTVKGRVAEKLDDGKVRIEFEAESPEGTNVSKGDAVIQLA
ncbi:MAG TPA: MaoC/PaaZ C-terminal domain-containing protein [Actinomycetota bacterium]|jgi:acyl dehydratase